ncbi:MAG: hypothetical protein AAF907_12035 [Planctomycetota bacterium]
MHRRLTAAAPISRGTHLARLAAGWRGESDSAHGASFAAAPPSLRRRLARRSNGENGDRWTGIAGAGFDRSRVSELAARFAATLPQRATVVLARDERPAHAALLPAAAEALRRAGSNVLHLGEALEPAVRFAVRSEQADGALWLAAPNFAASAAGLRVIGPGGRPLTSGEQAGVLSRSPRVDRHFGAERPCGAAAEYDASLWPAFRTLTALRITLASPSRAVQTAFERLFAVLPDDLQTVAVPHNATDEQIGERLAPRPADLRFYVDGAGVRCRVFDAVGSERPWAAVIRDLAADAVPQRRRPASVPEIAVADRLADSLRLKIAAIGGRVTAVADEPAALWAAVDEGCALAVGSDGFAVFPTPHGPSADAARVCAALMRVASMHRPGDDRVGRVDS